MAFLLPFKSARNAWHVLLLLPPFLALYSWFCLNAALGGHVGFHPLAFWLTARATHAQYCSHDLEAAERFDRMALDSLKCCGARDSLYAMTAEKLGTVLRKEGRPLQAERYYLDALSSRRLIFSDNSKWTVHSLTELGRLRREEGQSLAAISCFQEALKIDRALGGENSAATATAHADLGLMYNDTCNSGRALEELSQCVAIDRRVLGENNCKTHESKLLLAVMQAKDGLLGEARTFCDEELQSIERKDRSHRHMSFVHCLNLAILCSDLDKFAEAEPLFARALRKASRHGQQDSLLAMHIKQRWALMRFKQRRFSDAEKMANEVLAVRTKIIGAENTETAQPMFLLAHIYQATGRMDQAIAMYREVLKIREKTLGVYSCGSFEIRAYLESATGDQTQGPDAFRVR
jgi:tetratricopeptide (TPR) repeat protein